MAFSAGVFTRLYNWVTEQASSPIEVAKLDTQEEDFATALSNCILRDGTGVPSATTPWNSQRISGLGAPTTTGDAADVLFGSFTGTLTGMSGATTGTIYYVVLARKFAILWNEAAITGTSNTTAMTMTGLPAAVQPTGTVSNFRAGQTLVTNNSIGTFGYFTIANGAPSVMIFSIGTGTWPVPAYSSSGFTSSGTKGLVVGTMWAYPL